VGDDVGRPEPLRAQEQALDPQYIPPGSLRAQAGVMEDGRVPLGRLTAHVSPPRRMVVEDDGGGPVGPSMGLVVEDG